MPTFHRRIYWLLPTAASAPGGGGSGGGSSAGADGGGGTAGGSSGAEASEGAPAAPAAGGGAQAAATDAPNTNLVLVHYLDERHILTDPADPLSGKGSRGMAQRRGRQSQVPLQQALPHPQQALEHSNMLNGSHAHLDVSYIGKVSPEAHEVSLVGSPTVQTEEPLPGGPVGHMPTWQHLAHQVNGVGGGLHNPYPLWQSLTEKARFQAQQDGLHSPYPQWQNLAAKAQEAYGHTPGNGGFHPPFHGAAGGSGLGCASLYPQWELLTEKMTSRLGNGSEREEREREEEGVAFGLLSEAAPGEDAHLNLSHDTLSHEAGHGSCQLLEVEGGIESVDLLQEYSSSSSVLIQSMELDLEGTLSEGLHGGGGEADSRLLSHWEILKHRGTRRLVRTPYKIQLCRPTFMETVSYTNYTKRWRSWGRSKAQGLRTATDTRTWTTTTTTNSLTSMPPMQGMPCSFKLSHAVLNCPGTCFQSTRS
eukprot:Tamp_07889.p1 GENE.Tamp_07889~~Tamp_07889.p1  ORF type:complete len:477 (+),score=64.41 Tamp_07889:517-1947(+)